MIYALPVIYGLPVTDLQSPVLYPPVLSLPLAGDRKEQSGGGAAAPGVTSVPPRGRAGLGWVSFPFLSRAQLWQSSDAPAVPRRGPGSLMALPVPMKPRLGDAGTGNSNMCRSRKGSRSVLLLCPFSCRSRAHRNHSRMRCLG